MNANSDGLRFLHLQARCRRVPTRPPRSARDLRPDRAVVVVADARVRRPRRVSTTTVTPWLAISCTPSGVIATRCSSVLTSRGTPTVLIRSLTRRLPGVASDRGPCIPARSERDHKNGSPTRSLAGEPRRSQERRASARRVSRRAASATGRFRSRLRPRAERSDCSAPSHRDLCRRLREHPAQRRLDLVELGVARDEGRRELHHEVAAVVGPADRAPTRTSRAR